jgi:hypothetical protein
MPAGSSRVLRLDPMRLPAHFEAMDAGADGGRRSVELSAERVVLRRHVGGMRMALNVPLDLFIGVAVHVVPGAGHLPPAVAVALEHPDPALSVPLYVDTDSADIAAEWRLWSQALDLPMIVPEGEGFRAVVQRLGRVATKDSVARRRRRSAHRLRRPAFLTRRKTGQPGLADLVHQDEREIIARD